MRKYTKTVGAVAAASALVAGNAMAFEFDGEVHLGYSNMYEFRFVDLGNDLIESGVDLATELGGGFNLSAGAWYASYDIPSSIGNSTKLNFDELDLYAAVSKEVGPVTLELGYIYYYFPDASSALGLISPSLAVANTQEVYLGASYELPFDLTLGSTFFYDYDANSGWYWDTSLAYQIEFNECLKLDLGAGVAFADGLGSQARAAVRGGTGTHDGYQGFYLSAALPWEFRDGVTLSPYLKYTDADSDLSTDFYGNGGQDFLVGGVKLSVSF